MMMIYTVLLSKKFFIRITQKKKIFSLERLLTSVLVLEQYTFGGQEIGSIKIGKVYSLEYTDIP
jgi:hypothetical protein